MASNFTKSERMLSCEIRGMNRHLHDQVNQFHKMIPVMREVLHATHTWKADTEANHESENHPCEPCIDCDLVKQKSLMEMFHKQVGFLHTAIDALLDDVEKLYNFRMEPCKRFLEKLPVSKRMFCCEDNDNGLPQSLLAKKARLSPNHTMCNRLTDEKNAPRDSEDHTSKQDKKLVFQPCIEKIEPSSSFLVKTRLVGDDADDSSTDWEGSEGEEELRKISSLPANAQLNEYNSMCNCVLGGEKCGFSGCSNQYDEKWDLFQLSP